MEKTKLINNSCITCQLFVWWDGDYCCMKKLKILQESKDGKFTKDILISLKLNKDCQDYKEYKESIYKESFEEFLNNLNNV